MLLLVIAFVVPLASAFTGSVRRQRRIQIPGRRLLSTGEYLSIAGIDVILNHRCDSKATFFLILSVITMIFITSVTVYQYQEAKAQLRIEMDAFPYDKGLFCLYDHENHELACSGSDGPFPAGILFETNQIAEGEEFKLCDEYSKECKTRVNGQEKESERIQFSWCHNEGLKDGRNLLFDPTLGEFGGCTVEGQRDEYHEGFIIGCKGTGSTEEICERATD